MENFDKLEINGEYKDEKGNKWNIVADKGELFIGYSVINNQVYTACFDPKGKEDFQRDCIITNLVDKISPHLGFTGFVLVVHHSDGSTFVDKSVDTIEEARERIKKYGELINGSTSYILELNTIERKNLVDGDKDHVR